MKSLPLHPVLNCKTSQLTSGNLLVKLIVLFCRNFSSGFDSGQIDFHCITLKQSIQSTE